MWGPWGRVPARHMAQPASGACGALEGRGPVTRVSPDCPQGVPGAGSDLVKVMTGGQPISIVTGSLPSPTRAAWWLVASPTAPKVPQGLACCVTSRSCSLSVLTRAGHQQQRVNAGTPGRGSARIFCWLKPAWAPSGSSQGTSLPRGGRSSLSVPGGRRGTPPPAALPWWEV